MADKLGFVNYISIDGAEPVLFNSLTDEQREAASKIMSERISRSLNRYFASHPEELDAVFKEDGDADAQA